MPNDAMKYGAIHEPRNPAILHAKGFNQIRIGLTDLTDRDWFAACPADGDALLNDELSCCVPVADLRLIQLWLAQRSFAWMIPIELVRMRYEATGHFDGTPASDNGTIVQEDCFGWQAGPIAAADELWRVAWLTVQPRDVRNAMLRGPVLATLGLCPEDDGNLSAWNKPAASAVTDYHRVVLGHWRDGLVMCRTYGLDVLVHPSRIVGADLMIHTNGPAELRTAGIDWSAIPA